MTIEDARKLKTCDIVKCGNRRYTVERTLCEPWRIRLVPHVDVIEIHLPRPGQIQRNLGILEDLEIVWR